jgi:hypothetical protein
MRKPTLLILIVLQCFPGLAQTLASQQSSLKFTVPNGWLEEERTSSMRVAQFRLSKVATDTEDASLVLYYFGQGQGGSAAANIERWVGQMKQAEGGPSRDRAREEKLEAHGLKIVTLDVAGTYVAETAPGSGEFLNKPGYRLRAAVVETPKGPYFLKLVGPEQTVAHWNESFLSFLRSFEFK